MVVFLLALSLAGDMGVSNDGVFYQVDMTESELLVSTETQAGVTGPTPLDLEGEVPTGVVADSTGLDALRLVVLSRPPRKFVSFGGDTEATRTTVHVIGVDWQTGEELSAWRWSPEGGFPDDTEIAALARDDEGRVLFALRAFGRQTSASSFADTYGTSRGSSRTATWFASDVIVGCVKADGQLAWTRILPSELHTLEWSQTRVDFTLNDEELGVTLHRNADPAGLRVEQTEIRLALVNGQER